MVGGDKLVDERHDGGVISYGVFDEVDDGLLVGGFECEVPDASYVVRGGGVEGEDMEGGVLVGDEALLDDGVDAFFGELGDEVAPGTEVLSLPVHEGGRDLGGCDDGALAVEVESYCQFHFFREAAFVFFRVGSVMGVG